MEWTFIKGILTSKEPAGYTIVKKYSKGAKSHSELRDPDGKIMAESISYGVLFEEAEK